MKNLAVFLIALVLTLSISPKGVSAQEGVQVQENEVVSQFPEGIQFHLRLTSELDIESIILEYGINGRTCQTIAARQSMEVEPAADIDLDWDWEWIRSGILPPGAQVWWYWEIADVSGEVFTTPKKTIIIEDQRHDWKTISRNGVTVQWYEGGNSFGESIHTLALESLEGTENELGLKIDDDISITVYPTSEDVRDALLVTMDWTGGVAFTEHNSMIIGVSPNELAWAGVIIPHEINHLVVWTLIFNCYGVTLPTWLSEGLAELSEGPVTPQEADRVMSSLEKGNLPSLNLLARSFSAYGDDARLSYLQSKLVVQFMVDEYGAEHMGQLLAIMQSGKEIDSAMYEVYGFDPQGLDALWRESLGYSMPLTTPEDAELTPTSVPTLAPLVPLFQASATSLMTSTFEPSTPTPRPTSTIIPASHTPTSNSTATAPTTTPAGSQNSNLFTLFFGVIIGSILAIAAVIIFLRTRRL